MGETSSAKIKGLDNANPDPGHPQEIWEIPMQASISSDRAPRYLVILKVGGQLEIDECRRHDVADNDVGDDDDAVDDVAKPLEWHSDDEIVGDKCDGKMRGKTAPLHRMQVILGYHLVATGANPLILRCSSPVKLRGHMVAGGTSN